jgi:surfeit locus 1 family protein
LEKATTEAPADTGRHRRVLVQLARGRWAWATIAVALAAGLMIGLGFWQHARLLQRRALNAEVARQRAAPPVELTRSTLAGDVGALVERRVRLRGAWDYEHEIVLRNQARDGRPGVRVLTPLRLADGGAVLVDRGWLPYLDAAPARRAAYREAGQALVEGFVRPAQPSTGWLAPQEAATPGQGRIDAWLRVDLEAIQRQIPFPLLPIWVAQAAPTPPAALPWRGEPPPLSDGPHLGYAIQWWSFAAILLLGYGALARRAARGDEAPAVSP